MWRWSMDNDVTDDESIDNIEIYPAWRQAIENFKKAGFKCGDLLEYKWLYAQFHIVLPDPDMTYSVFCKGNLEFLNSWKMFESALLEEYKIALKNVRGVGYEIVSPDQQTGWADRSGSCDIQKAIRKQLKRLIYVDADKLTPEQKKENADSLARLANIRIMYKKYHRTMIDDRSIVHKS
jgi:hypothetical protein